jgi:hypothetical protein
MNRLPKLGDLLYSVIPFFVAARRRHRSVIRRQFLGCARIPLMRTRLIAALDAGLGKHGVTPKEVHRVMEEKLGGGEGWADKRLRTYKRAVAMAKEGCTAEQIARAVRDVSLDVAEMVIEVLMERGELPATNEPVLVTPTTPDHLRGVGQGAGSLRDLIVDGYAGWPPPEHRVWEPHLEDEVLEELLMDHLRVTDAGRSLAKWKREGRKLSRQAQNIIGTLRRRYPEVRGPDSEGLFDGFCESVYRQALRLARGGRALSAGYEKLKSGDMWELRQGAWGLARAKDEEALDRFIEQHKEAIRSLANDQGVTQLIDQENKVTRLARRVRSELGLYVHGRPIPGRCKACSESVAQT